MKKTASILLLGILVFNWCGYRFLGYYLEVHATYSLEVQLDEQNYEESDLISFKIPSKHLSSYAQSTGFERVDGQIEISGIQYNYVKRRLTGDSVEMLCIPNYAVTRVKKNSGEFFRMVNDIHHTGQGKKARYGKSYSAHYYKKTDSQEMTRLFYKESKLISFYFVHIPTFIPLTTDRPPDNKA